MKALPWILTGAGLGFVIASILLTEAPSPRYATGYDTGLDTIDDAAGKTGRWGSKQRIGGTGASFAGKLKEGLGRATGDDELAGEGVLDQAAGAVKQGVGELAQAAGQTLHDLNI